MNVGVEEDAHILSEETGKQIPAGKADTEDTVLDEMAAHGGHGFQYLAEEFSVSGIFSQQIGKG